MFGWFKNLFTKEESVCSEARQEETATEGEVKELIESVADFDSMNKAQLLDYAKSRNIKANTSMKKSEILAAIKSAG